MRTPPEEGTGGKGKWDLLLDGDSDKARHDRMMFLKVAAHSL